MLEMIQNSTVVGTRGARTGQGLARRKRSAFARFFTPELLAELDEDAARHKRAKATP